MDSLPNGRLIDTLIKTCIALFCITIIVFTDLTGKDFRVYRKGTVSIANRSAIYDPGAVGIPFAAPPTIAWFILPLIGLPDGIVAKIWLTISILCLFGCIDIVRKSIGKELTPVQYHLMIFIFLLLYPTRFTLLLGQINLMPLYLMTLAFFLLNRSGPHENTDRMFAGLILAIATGIKVLPLVLLPYLIIRKLWVACISYFIALSAMLFGAMSYFRISTGELLTLTRRMILPLFLLPNNHVMDVSNTQLNQSISSAISAFIHDTHLRAFLVVCVVTSLTSVIIIVWKKIRNQRLLLRTESDWFLFSSLLALGTLGLNGSVWVHHLVFLYPMILLYLAIAVRERKTTEILPVLLIIVCYSVDILDPAYRKFTDFFRYYGIASFVYVLCYFTARIFPQNIPQKNLNDIQGFPMKSKSHS